MPMHYLNDPDGRKEAQLAAVAISNPDEILTLCSGFLCQRLVHSDQSRLFFAQNLTTHIAQLLSLIKKKNPDITQVYMSDQEISWIKEMIEMPDYQPDATHSNYRTNEAITCPNFSVEVLSFHNFAKEISDKKQAAIFYISHISRQTGEIADIASIFKLIKKNNPHSVLLVDGAQSVGAMEGIELEGNCDVYLGLSSKFIGAEPHLGFAFVSPEFFQTYVGDRNNYLALNVDRHAKDIISLWNSLQNPWYASEYESYAKKLKDYAIRKLSFLNNDVVFNPPNQAPHFLTLNFGSVEKNRHFVDFAEKAGILLSENSGWSITTPTIPLVRIGLSVRVTEQDIDAVIETIRVYKKEAS